MIANRFGRNTISGKDIRLVVSTYDKSISNYYPDKNSDFTMTKNALASKKMQTEDCKTLDAKMKNNDE